MAKKPKTLLQAQPPLQEGKSLRWAFLVLALGSYLALRALSELAPLPEQWRLGPLSGHPALQQGLAVLRYLLPALFTGLALSSLAQRLSQGATGSTSLPWGLSVLLAVLSYLVLDALAATHSTPLLSAAPINQLLSAPAVQSSLPVLQYAVPALLALLAVTGQRGRPVYSPLFDAVADPNSHKTLESISWQEFEQLVGETFRRRGFRVSETQPGADGGVDLILYKGGKTYLVQCKQWKALKVGVNIVRELYGVMAAEGAVGGYVVTCGQFTEQAWIFAEGLDLHLIDGELLNTWITGSPHPAKPSTRAPQPSRSPSRQTVATPKTAASSPSSPAPACPICGAAMQKRVAKRGANAGNAFWGCSHYPQCRGVKRA